MIFHNIIVFTVFYQQINVALVDKNICTIRTFFFLKLWNVKDPSSLDPRLLFANFRLVNHSIGSCFLPSSNHQWMSDCAVIALYATVSILYSSSFRDLLHKIVIPETEETETVMRYCSSWAVSSVFNLFNKKKNKKKITIFHNLIYEGAH